MYEVIEKNFGKPGILTCKFVSVQNWELYMGAIFQIYSTLE